MTVKSYSQGYQIGYDTNHSIWIYSDTKENVTTARKCVKCECMPTKEGYDSCLGFLQGVSSACCGHGIEKPFAVLTSGEHLKFNNIEEMKDYFKI